MTAAVYLQPAWQFFEAILFKVGIAVVAVVHDWESPKRRGTLSLPGGDV
jgi:hypothetical protein